LADIKQAGTIAFINLFCDELCGITTFEIFLTAL